MASRKRCAVLRLVLVTSTMATPSTPDPSVARVQALRSLLLRQELRQDHRGMRVKDQHLQERQAARVFQLPLNGSIDEAARPLPSSKTGLQKVG